MTLASSQFPGHEEPGLSSPMPPAPPPQEGGRTAELGGIWEVADEEQETQRAKRSTQHPAS